METEIEFQKWKEQEIESIENDIDYYENKIIILKRKLQIYRIK